MKEISLMDEEMDREHFIIQVEQNISENGKQIKNMEKCVLIEYLKTK
jgi:hypothetical protein